MSATSHSGRLISLDILRACAVFLVIGRHINLPEQDQMSNWLWYPLAVWYQCGWVGVDLFFVLSGFLVSGLLFAEYQKKGSLHIRRFWIRRGLKIYPAFYFFLIVTLLVTFWQEKTYPLILILGEVFFIQNYVGGLWNHTWSLAVEEHFYFLLPLLLGGFALRNKNNVNPFKSIPVVVLCVSGAVLLVRSWHAWTVPYSHLTHMFPTHLRIDSLFFGVLLSYQFHFFRTGFIAFCQKWSRWLWGVGGLLLLISVIFSFDSVVTQSFGLTGIYVGAGLWLSAALVWEAKWWGLEKVIARIGRDSYSIYLWHMPVKVWILPLLFPSPTVGEVLVFLLLSVGFGMFVAKFCEWPILRLRDRWFPTRS